MRKMEPGSPEWIEDVFRYHTPEPAQVEKYIAVREAAKAFAITVTQQCPPSADRSATYRKIREAVMTANAAIALHGRA